MVIELTVISDLKGEVGGSTVGLASPTLSLSHSSMSWRIAGA